jgi:hypothetical protein
VDVKGPAIAGPFHFGCSEYLGTGLARLAHGVTPAENSNTRHHDEANLNEGLFGVEGIHRRILQEGIRENAVPEERESSRVNQEVKRLPGVASQSQPKVRSYDNDSEQIERGGAEGVIEWLSGRVHRINHIEDAKARGRREQQDNGMENGSGEKQIPGPIVQTEIIKMSMRPVADRAVTEGHHQTQKKIQSDEAYRNQTDVG